MFHTYAQPIVFIRGNEKSQLQFKSVFYTYLEEPLQIHFTQFELADKLKSVSNSVKSAQNTVKSDFFN